MIQREQLGRAVTCREDSTILDVSRTLRDEKQHHLFVLDFNEKVIGLISTVDIVTRVVAEGKAAESLRARDIMTRDVKVAYLDESYAKAYAIMIDLGTYSVPVVDKEGKLLGVLDYTKAKE